MKPATVEQWLEARGWWRKGDSGSWADPCFAEASTVTECAVIIQRARDAAERRKHCSEAWTRTYAACPQAWLSFDVCLAAADAAINAGKWWDVEHGFTE